MKLKRAKGLLRNKVYNLAAGILSIFKAYNPSIAALFKDFATQETLKITRLDV